MRGLLLERADALAGCTECSEDEKELAAMADALVSHEVQRWPDGKVPGGKG